MDRANRTSYAADHYYSQTPLEDGQHSSQPEAEQTSAGVPTSGVSWSHPAPGQTSLNPNWPAQILSSPGQDLEDLLRTPQAITLEEIIQNEPPPNPQLPVEKRRRKARKGQPTTKERFLAGLEAFERGALLKDCSATLQFSNYIKNDGSLIKRGVPLFNTFTAAEKVRLQQAVAARQRAILERVVDEDIVKARFLEGLDNYAQGVQLDECSATLPFKNYVSDTGRLTKVGREMRDGLSSEDQVRVNRALHSRSYIYRERKAANGPVEERFLAGLDKYAQGFKLANCSATLIFATYVTDDGHLQRSGINLRDSLTQKDQDRLNQALLARREIFSKRAMEHCSVEERFLAGLDNYERGVPIRECSKDIHYYHYVTDDGRLQSVRGQPLYNKLSQDDKVRVNRALTIRRRMASQRLARDVAKFMVTLEPYGNGLNLLDCGTQSGLMGRAITYLTPEGGLTRKGELLIENLQPDQLIDVKFAIEKRRQFLNPSAQVPESPWQLPEMPSSMPEMEWMDPDAMADPIQTGTMYDPMQTGPMYDPIQTGTMYDPQQTGSMVDPMQTGTMYDPMQTGSMVDLIQTGTMYDPQQMGMMYDPQQMGMMYDPQQTGSMVDPMQTGTMYDPQQTGSMVDLIQTGTMYDPQQTGTMYDPQQTGMMYDPMQTGSMYAPQQTGSMVDPMQMESMWASVWQLTGQTVPGPSEPAEATISYYDSEAVGVDFQHQHGPTD
ncbi:MAG: DUF4573 domain-containing protein [Reinekea sp.]